MRFVTGATTFKPNRGVLKREGPSYFGVALEATRLIGSHGPHHARAKAAVRIVAIYTGHCVLHQAMRVRLLKLCPNGNMATGTQFVDCGWLPRHQTERPVLMNLMAGSAGYFILHVAARNPPYMRRLIQMTGQTDAVGLSWRKFRGIANIGGGS